jgi:hypothetical protein
MVDGRDSEEQVFHVDRLQLSEFAPGTQFIIHLGGEGPYWAMLADPETGKGLVRPAIPGQRGAGYRDAMSTIGTRPYQEGAETHTSPKDDADTDLVEWGSIKFGDELVLRNEDEGADTVIFMGHRVEAVEVGQVVEG